MDSLEAYAEIIVGIFSHVTVNGFCRQPGWRSGLSGFVYDNDALSKKGD